MAPFLILAVLAATAVAEDGEDMHVTVLLRTTAKIDGIVRGGLERLENGSFKAVEKADGSDVGYRIWYSTGTNGFIFVRHHDIVRIENRGPVSDKQRQRLEEALRHLRDAATRSREEARQRLEALRNRHKAEEEAETETPEETTEETTEEAGGDAEEARREVGEALRQERDLLERFPPTEWKPERREQIRQNQVILGLAPSPREKEWLESFDLWKKAYDVWKAAQEKKPDEGEATSPAPSEGAGGESS